MTTAVPPNVPLPPGAIADPEGFAFWDNEFRTFHGVEHVVSDAAGRKIAEARTGGRQLPDGSLDTECPPCVSVYTWTEEEPFGLSSHEARGLAAALIEAADELDR